VNAFYASTILSFTVLLAVAFGILAAYSLVNGILFAFGRQSQSTPVSQAQPVLMARNAQAGAD
jgi:predicted outer membrane lipoprotein